MAQIMVSNRRRVHIPKEMRKYQRKADSGDRMRGVRVREGLVQVDRAADNVHGFIQENNMKLE